MPLTLGLLALSAAAVAPLALPGAAGAASTTTPTTATPGAASTTPTTAAPSAPSAPATPATKAFTLPGRVVALSQPQADSSMWVLAGTSTKKSIYHVNVNKQKVLGKESVSAHADAIALSANNYTLALGTTGGAYPAVVWYYGITSRFNNAARSTAPVTSLAVNAAGNTIYALRSSASQKSVYALGTANSLGFPYLIPGTPVDIAPAADGHSMLVLQSDGTVGSLSLPAGVYTTSFGTGAPAKALALSPDGTTAYVLRSQAATTPTGSIVEVNVAQGTVIKTIATTGDVVDIVLSADGHTLYEAQWGTKDSSIRAIAVP